MNPAVSGEPDFEIVKVSGVEAPNAPATLMRKPSSELFVPVETTVFPTLDALFPATNVQLRLVKSNVAPLSM